MKLIDKNVVIVDKGGPLFESVRAFAEHQRRTHDHDACARCQEIDRAARRTVRNWMLVASIVMLIALLIGLHAIGARALSEVL